MIRKGNKMFSPEHCYSPQFRDLEEIQHRTDFQKEKTNKNPQKTGCKLQNNLIEHLDILKSDL